MVQTDNIHQLVCISCPMGCRLTLVKDEKSPQGYKIDGNTCKRGVEYAIKEVTDPTRMVTSTVKITGALLPRLPVRTDKPIPKAKIMECMKIINSLEVNSPVKMGKILVKDLFGTGSNIIATRSL
ncbi:MAG: DUF1667 domain-containing protein [Candidatus Riflebacteria bacterium]|nr:DUF1667 domain-containing protein [Candidatus Riflebacteria bacterium]